MAKKRSVRSHVLAAIVIVVVVAVAVAIVWRGYDPNLFVRYAVGAAVFAFLKEVLPVVARASDVGERLTSWLEDGAALCSLFAVILGAPAVIAAITEPAVIAAITELP